MDNEIIPKGDINFQVDLVKAHLARLRKLHPSNPLVLVCEANSESRLFICFALFYFCLESDAPFSVVGQRKPHGASLRALLHHADARPQDQQCWRYNHLRDKGKWRVAFSVHSFDPDIV